MERIKTLFRKKVSKDRLLTILKELNEEIKRQNYAPYDFYLPCAGSYYHESVVNEWLKGVTRH